MPNINVPGVGVVAFPDTMSQDEIGVAIRQDILPSIQKSGFGAGLSGGLESLKGAALAAKYGVTGSEADRQALLESQARAAEKYQGVGLEDVQEAFRERGVLAGLGRTWEAAKGTLGQSIPFMAAPAIGAAVAPAAIPAGIAGLSASAIGFAAPSIAQYTGTGLARQVEEQQAAMERGEQPRDLSVTKAVVGAIPATVLDRFALGKTFKGTPLGKLFGEEGEEAVKAVTEKVLSGKTAPSRLLSGAAGLGRGVSAEIGNEVGQQIIERAQAGLDLTGEEAMREYKQAAFGAALLGGPIGTMGGLSIRKAGLKGAEQTIEEARAELKRVMGEREAYQANLAAQNLAQTQPQLPGLEMPAVTPYVRPEEAVPTAPEFELTPQNVQGELGLEEPVQPVAPEVAAPAPIDNNFLKSAGLSAGIGLKAKGKNSIIGMDLNDPEQAAKIRERLVKVGETTKSGKLAEAIETLLKTDTRLQEQPEIAGFPTEAEQAADQVKYDQAQAEAARQRRNQQLEQLRLSLPEVQNAAKEEAATTSAGVPSEVGAEGAPGGLEPSVGVYERAAEPGTQAGEGPSGEPLGLTERDVEGAVAPTGRAGDTLNLAELMFEAEAEADRQIAEERAAKEAAPKTPTDWEALLAAEGMPEDLEAIPTETETAEEAAARIKEERRAQRAMEGELTGELTWDTPRFSEGQGGVGVDANKVRDDLKKSFAMPARFDDRVTVVQSVNELPEVAKQDLSQAKSPDRVQAFVGSDGRVYMIADNVVPGEEMGVFLHELGAHVGMEGLIGPANVRALTGQIMKWADMGGNTQESQIAQRAMARAEASTAEDKSDEVIAYFVEEAVKAGVDPIAVQELNNPLGRWFRKLWASVKVGLRKLGMGKVENLTTQNIVDLAYGAANLELSGAWHGTGADFRKFNHAYMGSGEGAQAFGWGTYLAQRPGIGKEYMKADVERKAMTGPTYDGKPIEDMDWDQRKVLRLIVKDVLEKGLTVEGSINGWKDYYSYMINNDYSTDKVKAAHQEKLNYLNDIDASKINVGSQPEGNLMRIAVNANENEMLDWDQPITKQSQQVQTVVNSILDQVDTQTEDAIIGSFLDDELYYRNIDREDITGNDLIGTKREPGILVKAISEGLIPEANDRVKPYQAASEYLDSLGVKGIKFYDRPSRARAAMGKEGKPLTRNLVVFNDKNIVRAVSYKGAEKGKVKFSEAADRLAKMGRSVKDVEQTSPFQEKVDAVKEVVKAPQKWRDLVETMVFSADAKINNEIRRSLNNKLEQGGQEAADAMAKLYSISTSQALHAEAVAHQFIEKGNIKYDPTTYKFQAVEDQNSWANMVQELKKIADQYGHTFPEMEAYAQAALEARRLKGVNEFNDRIEKEATALEAKGKKQQAEKHREKQKLSHMTNEQIDMGMEFFKEMPELNKIVDMWNGIRKNAMKAAVESGLYSQERAEELLEIMDYVPFYRVEQIESKAGPKEFSRGLLDAAREYRFKGSEQEVNNIFDNMERWTSYTIRRAVNNKTAQNLVQTARDVLQEAKAVPKPQRGMEANTIAIWEDGERNYYEFSDPLFVKAFTGLEPVALPAFKALSTFSNALRKNIVLNPLFSVSQLSQDSFAAMLTSGLKQPFKLPIEVMKEFVKTLRGTSQAHEELKAYGAVGVRDYSAAISRLDAEMAAGLKAPSTWQKLLAPLEKFSMASDNAVRQAIYNMTMQETGGDKAKAIERAFEIINFRRKGASGTLAIAGQVIPFFNAYLQAQNVAYKVLTARGVSPTARSEAKKVFIGNATKIAALAFIYAAVMADDDDYKKMDPTIRDRHWIIPGTGLMLPTRTDLFSMPKIVAEHTYALLTDQGFEDGTKARRAMSDAIKNAILGPTPVPQAFKPLVEVALNRNFYMGRPIIGRGIENLATAEQFTASTSEFAKAIGSTGLIAPVNVDHLLRGYFGTTGGLVLMATDAAINSVSGVPKPAKSTQDILASTPGLSAFVSKEFGSAAKTDFYELKGMVDEVGATLNRYAKTGRLEEAREYLGEEETKNLLRVKQQVNQIQANLSKLRERENLIRALPETRMSADQKEMEIRKLRETEQRMLANVSKLRGIAGL